MLPDRHDYPFDPTYGCDRAALEAITAPPAIAGFDTFWRATRAAADAVPLNLTREASTVPVPGWRQSIIHFDSLGGFRIGAWLLEPDVPCRAGIVVGHGYGGREAPPVIDPNWPQAERAVLLAPCMPGFHLSAVAGVPGDGARHVVLGIDDPDTYILRFCVAALWTSTRALATLHPETAGRLAYEGGSFGGGRGALAAPWEPLWSCARRDVPTFGHHPWRLRCPCTGSGESVRKLHAQRPEIARTLGFFDAAVAATRARMPGFIVPALFDPAVPPPGQWAVANAWAGMRVLGELSTGHHDGPWTPGEQQANNRIWTAVRLRHQLG